MILSEEYRNYLKYFVTTTSWLPDAVRILKVAEEVGEVSEAFIGLSIVKPKYQRLRTTDEVTAELGDVIMTALVAIVALGHDPDLVLEMQWEKTREKYGC